jgi:two-component system cell cycle sensor histidine kinase/response regulator CckA
MGRILIVEASPTQAHALCRLLQEAGFSVTLAGDGRQALELLRTAAYDLVLTDVQMPVLDGYELCRQIKFDPKKCHLPVLLLTALTDPLDILRGIECGADNYLTKPCEPNVLINRIRFTLARIRHRRADRLSVGIKVTFLGQAFTITAEREQLLEVLLSVCEDVVRVNRQLRDRQDELAAAKAQAEQYAHHQEGKSRRLMEQAHDAIVLADLDGTLLEVNRRTEELLGRPAVELVGRRFDEFLPAEDREAARALFQQLLNEGYISQDNGHVSGPSGRRVTVDYSASLVEVGGERLVLGILHDATEREQLEAQLLQAQKMEAVGRLAGGVAHDFNNLLTVINGYSEVLLGRMSVGDPGRSVVSEILGAGQRAAGLARQLLSFSRKQVIQPVVLDLGAVVTGIAKLLRRLIGEDVELTVSSEPHLGHVKADTGLLEQVLVNLAVNARDAMPKGGKLSIEVRNIVLEKGDPRLPPAIPPGRYVRLAVADTGCGMTEEVKEHLFEPFFTTKEQGKGTGLGLATVYGIVRQAGGFVQVRSEVNRGSTFAIYLPRVEESATPAAAQSAAPVPMSGTETLLLVEDEDSVRALVRLALKSRGYTVLSARHGTEALALCQRHDGPIHLLVTDVVMPLMGGRELANQLRARDAGLRVLYLSGHADQAMSRHGAFGEGEEFLQKPFSVDTLTRKVREVLDRPARSPVERH